MKKEYRIILVISAIMLFICLFGFNKVEAATATITDSKTVTQGDKVTVNAKVTAGGWNLTLSGKGTTKRLVGNTTEAGNANASTSISFTADEVGTFEFTLKGDITDYDTEKTDSISKTCKITVKAKEQTPNNGGNTGTTSKPKEPTFTKVNETVYVTKKVNVRQSYSTSSKSLGMLEVGESLKRTGKGSNGWSRVTYNGKEAYVNASYLSTKKPEEKPEEEVPTEKSNSKALKSLEVTPGELVPAFNPEVTKYTLTFEEVINEISVNAVAEDEKAKVEVTGNKELKTGENTITIKVTAEDETVRTYTITVENAKIEKPKLMILTPKNGKLNPIFQSDVYSYELTLTENLLKLDFDITALGDDTKYEIRGNENLKDGSVITIVVYQGTKGEDGYAENTYELKVKKDANVAALPTIGGDNQTRFIVIATIVILAVGIIALLVARYYTTKGKKKEEDFGVYDGLSGKDKEDNDYEEMRRSFPKIEDNFNPEDDNGLDGRDDKPRGKRFM